MGEGAYMSLFQKARRHPPSFYVVSVTAEGQKITVNPQETSRMTAAIEPKSMVAR
jgi:hypothetical protein